jgi:DNA polymerase-3 subunit epsilon
MVGVREASVTGERNEIHVFRDWCWLGRARDQSELQSILDAPPRSEFDLDIYRLLVRRLPRARIIPLGHTAAA